MSISGILSSNLSQYQLSAASNLYQQGVQQLSKDLQSGNLSAAQSDFAILQKAFSQPATTTPSTSDPVAQAFNQLATDLQTGNLSAAQKDFSTLQQDLQSQGNLPTTHFHHHSHHGGGDSSTQNSLLLDPNQVGQNLTSSNLAGAQQAYATLRQELQQFALGGGTQSSTLLAQMPVSLEA
jgi:hypothetical protein